MGPPPPPESRGAVRPGCPRPSPLRVAVDYRENRLISDIGSSLIQVILITLFCAGSRSPGYSRQPAPLATFTSSPVAALNLLDQAPSGVVVALVETGQLEGLLARWSAVIEQIPALAELLRDYADKDALRAL